MNPLQNLYEVIDVLKENKNGKVFLVYDKTAKQVCVLKERNLKTAEIYKTLKKIKNPYLPEIFRTVEFCGKFFVVEEFVEGRTLAEILTYNNGLDEKVSARILKEICKGLKILHDEKIIHRDLKPSNIMLTKTNSVKLIDFSISRIEKENSESDTDFLGTRGYAPPEQFGFGQTDPRSDIYSLGITIKKLLGDDYNGYLKKILLKCTELDPKNRYQSVEEISADVDKKFWQYRLKKFYVGIGAVIAIISVALLIPKNIFEENPPSEEQIQVEDNPIREESPDEKKSEEQPAKNFEWSEIKYPDSVNLPAPTIPKERNNFPVPVPSENFRDSPKNKICTLLLNGKIYENGDGEIPKEIWLNWRRDKDKIYLPENFSLRFQFQNASSAPLSNISVQIGEKTFSIMTIVAGETQTFDIPLGNMELVNGRFEIEIWLREGDEPLICTWNNDVEGFSPNKLITIYLLDYNQWRAHQ